MESFKRRFSGVLFLFMTVVLLNGCILKSSPSTQTVIITAGKSCAFSIKTLVTPTSVVWSLDTAVIIGATTRDYTYSPGSVDIGNHILSVTETSIFGQGAHTWYIQVTPSATSTYSIKGTITVNGNALGNITVQLSGGSTLSTITASDGGYTFSDLEDGDYTVTPSTAMGYIFVPVNRAVTINGADVTSIDFAATTISEPAPQFLHYTLPDQYSYVQNGGLAADEAATLFSSYTLTYGILYKDGSLVSGYALSQFVDKNTVNEATPDPDGVLGIKDARKLYSLFTRSNMDGFSIRTHFLTLGIYTTDLRWDQFIQGYLLDMNYSGSVFYPTSVGVVNKHNNKYAYDIYMFRKIDVKRPDAAGSLATFEVQATTDSYVDDTNYHSITGLWTTKFTVGTMSFGAYTNVKAISLVQFLTDYVTNTPNSYTYKIVAVDDTFKEGWTYADMQRAYYLPDYDFIIQVDGSNNIISGTKINYPVRIELISGSNVEYDYSAKTPPAFAKAY
jgi:hypothetical protein